MLVDKIQEFRWVTDMVFVKSLCKMNQEKEDLYLTSESSINTTEILEVIDETTALDSGVEMWFGVKNN